MDDLRLEISDEKVSFPWFPAIPTPEELKAYDTFICKLCEMARNAKRVVAKEKKTSNDKSNQYQNEINQAQYNSMVQILQNADKIERRIKGYWNSNRFQRDFMYYIGLHYASHLLAGAIKAGQQKIKETFVSCKNRQEQWPHKIEIAQRQQERLYGEQRYKLSAKIGEMCKIHKRISTLKEQIGAINTQYNNSITQQNIETARRRDYIGSHFGEHGERWRAKIMSKHR